MGREVTFTNNGGNALWSNPENWSEGMVPEANDTVLISGDTCIADVNQLNGWVTISDEGVLSIESEECSADSISLDGGSILKSINASVMFTAPVSVLSPSRIVAVGGELYEDLEWYGQLYGQSRLFKTGLGALNIEIDAQGFTGSWEIDQGRIRVRSPNALSVDSVFVGLEGVLDIEEPGLSLEYLRLKSSGEMKGKIELDRDISITRVLFGNNDLLSGTYVREDFPDFITQPSTLTIPDHPNRDCMKYWLGGATYDDCGVCAGGRTGYFPCVDIPEGYYMIKATHADLCLEKGFPINQQPCDNQLAPQVWYVEKEEEGYRITSGASAEGMVSENTSLQLGDDFIVADAAPQHFRLEEDNNGTIILALADSIDLTAEIEDFSAAHWRPLKIGERRPGFYRYFEFIPLDDNYDCANEWAGEAVIDSCGNCAGGNTGIPIETDLQNCVSSLEDISFSGLEVYPNPFDQQVNVEVEGENLSVSLWTSTGRKLLEKTGKSTVDISSDAPPGVYFLEVVIKEKQVVVPVVKQ